MSDQRRSFRFLHCADLHLDGPCTGLRHGDPQLAAVLRETSFRAFDNAIELALSRQVELILIAGDVYDSAEGSLQGQLRFRDGLDRARAAGIPCCLAHGNCDPHGDWEIQLPLPAPSRRFAAGKVERLTVERDGRPLVDVYGTSFPTRDVTENLAGTFRRDGPAPWAIGLLHCNLGGDPRHGNQAPCSLDDLVGTGLDYWALGHIHEPQVVRQSAPTVVYAGCVQGRNIRETGPRGCFVVTVDEAGVFHPEFVATDTVRWFDRTVDIGPFEQLQSLRDHLGDLREEVRSAAEGRPALIRMRLIGSGPQHVELQRPEIQAELADPLRENPSGRSDFVWLTSLEVGTRTPVDLDDRRQVDDFVGEFLRAAATLRRREGAAHAIRQLLLDRPGHAALQTEIDALSDDQLLSLLDEAESLGSDLLLPEGG